MYAAVKNKSGTAIPQGVVIFHFRGDGAQPMDFSCVLAPNGRCGTEQVTSWLWTVVSADYVPTGNFTGSTSAPTGTGR